MTAIFIGGPWHGQWKEIDEAKPPYMFTHRTEQPRERKFHYRRNEAAESADGLMPYMYLEPQSTEVKIDVESIKKAFAKREFVPYQGWTVGSDVAPDLLKMDDPATGKPLVVQTFDSLSMCGISVLVSSCPAASGKLYLEMEQR